MTYSTKTASDERQHIDLSTSDGPYVHYYSTTANGAGPRIVVTFDSGSDPKQALQKAKGEYSKVYGGIPRGLSFSPERSNSKEASVLKVAHDSGDGADISHCPFCGSGSVIGGHDGTVECEFCFAGETEFITIEGVRTLKETVGTIQRVLVSQAAIDGKDSSEFGGRWVDAEIQSFGVQPLMAVTLSRHGVEKVIYATAEHRWLVTPATNQGYRSGRRDVTLTKDLVSGARLAPLFARDRLHQGPRQTSSRKTADRTAWKVVSVEETERIEEVYCAVVPGWENFTLAENINVMNCHRFFTVQVQPEFRGMPQTINGQPFDVPGMPGQGPDAGAAQQEQATEAGDALLDGDPHGLLDAKDPQNVPPKGANPFAKGPAKPPAKPGGNPFAKASLLVTKEGMALPPEAYLQHLALQYATDRDAVLSQVRTENSR